MTRETLQNPQGGTKKFLYSGPASKKRGTQFDDDVDDREWNFQPTVTTGIQSDDNKFDFDGVWSIKKNVTIPNNKAAAASKPGPHDGWNPSMGTSYYSRHGALLGDGNTDQLEKAGQSGGPGTVANKSWGNQGSSRNFSYTQAGPSSQLSGPMSPSTDSPSLGNGNLIKTGGISPGGRYGTHNAGKFNNSRHF